MFDLAAYMGDLMQSMDLVSLILSGIINLLFANGVAKDIHALHARSLEPHLVSGSIWVLATTLGGLTVAAIYWALHHSSLGK